MSQADAQIADFALTPITKSTTGHNMSVAMAARSLYATFAANLENKTTRCVVDLAISGMTCPEYDEAEAGAIAIAKTEDTANGWNPPASVKGRAKYGPRQSSCASMASQRRQVFGAIRLGGMSVVVSVPDSGIVNFDTLPTWPQALMKAREYLSNPTGAIDKKDRRPVDWTGRPTEDKRRERNTRAENALSDQAITTAKQKLPRKPGEDYADWTLRVLESDEYADAMEVGTAKQIKDTLTKVYASLVKEHGQEFVYDLGSYIRCEELKSF